ncbi:MAG: ATP-binding cassette domain-containing protein [Culicoidibacterales bacterium]
MSLREASTLYGQLDFIIQAGKITTILGSNGSGKSTVLHLLSASLKPNDGTMKQIQLVTLADKK